MNFLKIKTKSTKNFTYIKVKIKMNPILCIFDKKYDEKYYFDKNCIIYVFSVFAM